MTRQFVFATATLSTSNPETGLIVSLSEGETWAADDPFVIARPSFFSAQPPRLRRTRPAPSIETATKSPGERKTVNRG